MAWSLRTSVSVSAPARATIWSRMLRMAAFCGSTDSTELAWKSALLRSLT
ncbi:MAG: hypothetical protein IPL19_24990 [Sandaracinaceae bacterium]|nr:hypothetical protein [Sandaracinaceae bacterium]